jgi:DNA phosphorothioation-dependent restriction protein DptH
MRTRELSRRHEGPGEDLGLQRTDLAIFDLDGGERLLTCRLVEVKCHGASGEAGVLDRLKAQIVAQLEASRRMLADRFESGGGDRPDGALVALDVSTLLGFYLDRAVRYGLFDRDAEREARAFLLTLENGYRLRFTKSALVFDLDRTDADAVEVEGDIEYHLVGRNSIRRLDVASRDDLIGCGLQAHSGS